uniref:Uncharacterized protein n=1 Tax=Arundo donax TaxID=35708 RepID=A0A0A9GK82_ARUDO
MTQWCLLLLSLNIWVGHLLLECRRAMVLVVDLLELEGLSMKSASMLQANI